MTQILGAETRAETTLSALEKAEARCKRCPLYLNATQVVPGQGSREARLMFVGEQPSDMEDRAGKPFVGPAGKVFDRALEDAGIPRREVFVTNAVKHFKFDQRGKRRLHKRPNTLEIERCKWWLDQERGLVKPALIVMMGATAVRSLLGRPGTISKLRGRAYALADGSPYLVTVHPSYLLRIRDQETRQREYNAFVEDLMQCWRVAGSR